MPQELLPPPLRSESDFENLYLRAQEIGQLAGEALSPAPMVVVERQNPFDDSSPIIRQYAPEPAGACGFAWVNIKPGNSRFANWLKKNGLARKDSYYGGVSIWIRQHGQSYEKKIAHARALAEVLSEAGIKAYASGRLD